MKAVMNSFRRFFSGVLNDYMLVACILAPLIMGAAFHFGIPSLESYLCKTFTKLSVLSPYYLVFDLLISVMTPVMFSFSGVMTTLEELDNGTARYLMVTPVGKKGYLLSRIGIPSIVGIVYGIIVIAVFGLSGISIVMNIAVSVLCAVTGIITSMIVIAFAGNKVEGMALIKLSGIIILGIPAMFFLPSPIMYVSGVLPSSWFTLMARSGNYLYSLPALLVSAIWMTLLYKKFSSKLI